MFCVGFRALVITTVPGIKRQRHDNSRHADAKRANLRGAFCGAFCGGARRGFVVGLVGLPRDDEPARAGSGEPVY